MAYVKSSDMFELTSDTLKRGRVNLSQRADKRLVVYQLSLTEAIVWEHKIAMPALSNNSKINSAC